MSGKVRRWLRRLFGGRARREAERSAVASALRALIDEEGATAAWPRLAEAMADDAESTELYRIAGRLLRAEGARGEAVILARAADAPHDPQRLFEAGSVLTNLGEPRVAAPLLEQALTFAPFDAVIRAELALAQARMGEPDAVIATLALHPCLADDPGALFELAWASLLTGDIETAERSLAELERSPRTSALRARLAEAIERGRFPAATSPPDARDFYFIEQGGLLLDADGELGGRYGKLEGDAAWAARLVARAAASIASLSAGPHRVLLTDPSLESFARALADALGGEVVSPGAGRLPPGVALLADAPAAEALDPKSVHASVLRFALTMDPRRSWTQAPEMVGVMAAEPSLAPEPASATTWKDPALAAFIEARRALLPPAAGPVRGGYVPDAPLPMPPGRPHSKTG